jgi:putative nucleotidyltransferase with HDIG domain
MKWEINNYVLSDNTIDFSRMKQDFHFIKGLENCDQGSKYHSEGNVWIHTKMCLEYLLTMKEYQELPEDEKSLLFLAVFFHDIGKPSTTKKEDGKITSYNHAYVGMKKSRDLLWGLDACLEVSWKTRENVANLINLHMLPAFFLKEKSFRPVFASSFLLKTKWLYILAMADAKGRICLDEKSQQEAEESVQLFKMLCEENDCFDKPKFFHSDNARFRYFFEKKGVPELNLYEEEKGNVIMMSGIQGSGKSWTIKQNYSAYDLVGLDETRISLGYKFGDDEDEVMRNAKEQCKELMRKNKNFVFNATNTIKEVRAKWIRLFRQYGYKVTIHYVEKDLKQTLKQNKNREAVVPESVILEKFSRIEIPTLLECHRLILDVPE